MRLTILMLTILISANANAGLWDKMTNEQQEQVLNELKDHFPNLLVDDGLGNTPFAPSSAACFLSSCIA
ncbi:MAG: hypothetical protein KKD01_02505 [Proteobacteria bacterium]|nr:hypothetical protein [Pseudomonadota bacterium]MBU1453573.1 hypothetical protein [Pseudomonadota bacterium]